MHAAKGDPIAGGTHCPSIRPTSKAPETGLPKHVLQKDLTLTSHAAVAASVAASFSGLAAAAGLANTMGLGDNAPEAGGGS